MERNRKVLFWTSLKAIEVRFLFCASYTKQTNRLLRLVLNVSGNVGWFSFHLFIFIFFFLSLWMEEFSYNYLVSRSYLQIGRTWKKKNKNTHSNAHRNDQCLYGKGKDQQLRCFELCEKRTFNCLVLFNSFPSWSSCFLDLPPKVKKDLYHRPRDSYVGPMQLNLHRSSTSHWDALDELEVRYLTTVDQVAHIFTSFSSFRVAGP